MNTKKHPRYDESVEFLQKLRDMEFDGKRALEPIIDSIMQQIEQKAPEIRINIEDFYPSIKGERTIHYIDGVTRTIPELNEDNWELCAWIYDLLGPWRAGPAIKQAVVVYSGGKYVSESQNFGELVWKLSAE